jgi:hypothetical protein
MIPFLDSLFVAVGQGLKIWDHYNKTKYYRQYEELMNGIRIESGKDINERDQAKIDVYQYKLMLLLGQFNAETLKAPVSKSLD